MLSIKEWLKTLSPEDKAIWKKYGGKTVEYEYGLPALSCFMNGKRIKGKGKVTDLDVEGGLVIDGHLRIRESEVTKIL